jgi:photosystem II stability/assembly factor-like uncharacterized protein
MALHLPPAPQYAIQTQTFSSFEVAWDIVTDQGRQSLYRTEDGGRHWQVASHALQAGAILCQPVGNRDGWCLGGEKSSAALPGPWQDSLLGTTDGGRRFTAVGTVPMVYGATGLGFASLETGAVLGGHDLWLTRDAGRTFTHLQLDLSGGAFLSQVDVVSAQEIYLVTDAGRLLETRDGGRSWRQVY